MKFDNYLVLFKAPKLDLHIHLQGAVNLHVFSYLVMKNRFAVLSQLKQDVELLDRISNYPEMLRLIYSDEISIQEDSNLFSFTSVEHFFTLYKFVNIFIRSHEDFELLVKGVIIKLYQQHIIYADVLISLPELIEQGIHITRILQILHKFKNINNIHINWWVDLVRHKGPSDLIGIYNCINNEGVAFKRSGNYLSKLIFAHGNDSVTDAIWNSFFLNESSKTNITVDGTVEYSYNSNMTLASIKDVISKYEMKYTYDSLFKISKIEEYGNSTSGKSVVYENNSIRNSNDIVTKYVLDNKGRVISSYSQKRSGSEVYSSSNGSYENGNTNAINSIKLSSNMGGLVSNNVIDGGFEKANTLSSYWKKNGTVNIVKNDTTNQGNKVSFLMQNGTTSSIYQYVLIGSKSTLSFDIMSNAATDVDLWVEIVAVNNSSRKFTKRFALDKSSSGIDKFYAVFDNIDITALEVYKLTIGVDVTTVGSSAYVYIDNVSLVNKNAAQEFNLVNDGGFGTVVSGSSLSSQHAISTFWTQVSGSTDSAATASGTAQTGLLSSSGPQRSSVLQINGEIDKWKSVDQVIFSNSTGITFTTPQVFTVSGYGMSSSNSQSGKFGLQLEYKYGTVTKKEFFPFINETDEWQYVSGTVIIPSGKAIKELKVRCVYAENIGTGYIDEVCVTQNPGSAVVSNKYYSNGKIERTASGDQCAFYSYYDNGDVKCVITNHNKIVYTYVTATDTRNENLSVYNVKTETVYVHNNDITQYNDFSSANSGISATLYCTIEYVYNKYGQVKEVDTKMSGTNAKTQIEKYAYIMTSGNAALGALETYTDVQGNVTRYIYDSKKGWLLAVIEPDGNGTSYTYDASGKLTSVMPAKVKATTSYDKITGSAKVDYTYDTLNRVSSIKTNGTVYNFVYDNFGNTSSVKINNSEILSIKRSTNNGRISSIKYNNGVEVRYTYDILDRITEIVYYNSTSYDEIAHYQYGYDTNGNVSRFTDTINHRETVYGYGKNGELQCFAEIDTSKNNKLYSAWYKYDQFSRLEGMNYSFNTNGNI